MTWGVIDQVFYLQDGFSEERHGRVEVGGELERQEEKSSADNILSCRILVITERRESLYVMKHLLKLPQRGAVGATE